MRQCQVVESGTPDAVLGSPQDPYTAELLASVPVLGRKLQLEELA